MSLIHGLLRVSGTRIEGFGYTKQNVYHFPIYLAIVCPFHSMAANLPYLPGSPSLRRGPNFLRPACP